MCHIDMLLRLKLSRGPTFISRPHSLCRPSDNNTFDPILYRSDSIHGVVEQPPSDTRVQYMHDQSKLFHLCEARPPRPVLLGRSGVPRVPPRFLRPSDHFRLLHGSLPPLGEKTARSAWGRKEGTRRAGWWMMAFVPSPPLSLARPLKSFCSSSSPFVEAMMGGEVEVAPAPAPTLCLTKTTLS